MIKILKLQKAVILIILGIIALVVYKVLVEQKNESSKYFLEAAGVLFMVGALMFLYPILFSRKDKAGNVELDPEIDPEAGKDGTAPVADGEVRLP
jgi:drug/metabolite transporter superfamily protein YnfA